MTTSSNELVTRVVSKVLDRVDVEEVLGEDGGPYQTLTSIMEPIAGHEVGSVRLYRGDVTIVTAAMTSPAIGLDTHQVTVFTKPGSAVPHFSADAAIAPMIEGAFHVGADLLPRMDIQSNAAYLDAVYRPLNEIFQTASSDDRLPAADGLDPVRRGLRSPWLFASYVEGDDLPAAAAVVDAYVDHWLSLLGDGAALSADTTAEELAARDQRYRSHLFAPTTNPLWSLIDRLLGESAGAAIRGLLADPHGA